MCLNCLCSRYLHGGVAYARFGLLRHRKKYIVIEDTVHGCLLSNPLPFSVHITLLFHISSSEQRSFWEANSFSASAAIPSFYRTNWFVTTITTAHHLSIYSIRGTNRRKTNLSTQFHKKKHKVLWNIRRCIEELHDSIFRVEEFHNQNTVIFYLPLWQSQIWYSFNPLKMKLICFI
jgi:hypothetical protein